MGGLYEQINQIDSHDFIKIFIYQLIPFDELSL